ncbi:MAG TPA: hypothetical protein VE398_09715 [Acidobacteriota bacterium]|nr:hypothetical protein [Acidobacteriota bacterium]
MRVLEKSIICAAFLTLIIPSIAASYDRDYRDRDKHAAYRAGFDEGYRNGIRRGEYDSRLHLRNNYHSREYDRAGSYYDRGYFHNNGQYKKGYKDGYRQGYRDGYRRIDFRRYPRERYW